MAPNISVHKIFSCKIMIRNRVNSLISTDSVIPLWINVNSLITSRSTRWAWQRLYLSHADQFALCKFRSQSTESYFRLSTRLSTCGLRTLCLRIRWTTLVLKSSITRLTFTVSVVSQPQGDSNLWSLSERPHDLSRVSVKIISQLLEKLSELGKRLSFVPIEGDAIVNDTVTL